MRSFTILALAGAMLVSAKEKPVRPADAYAEINGIKMHYVVAGKGPLIIFLHGFPEFWYEWKNQIMDFGRDHLVVAPDMRGYNLSEKPDRVEQYGMQFLVEDVRALADHLNRKKFTLVAHDWGGAIAWQFAMAHPEYLDKLVIINAPHPTLFGKLLRSDPNQQKASQYMLMFRSPQAEQTLTGNAYATLTNIVLGAGLKSGVFNEQDKMEYLRAWSQPGAITGGLNYYRAAQIGPPPPGVEAPAQQPAIVASQSIIKTPTMVIWGEKDTALLTSNLDGLDTVVSSVTVKRIPEGSHWVIHEKPAEVNGYIREFLRK